MRPTLFTIAIIFTVAVAVAITIRITAQAGSLTPPAAPSSTFINLEDIHASIDGSFDVSTSTVSATGTVIEILRCIITKKEGGTC